MNENIAWIFFTKTGNINTFLEYKELEKAVKEMKESDIYEFDKNNGNSTKRSEL